MKIGVVGSGIAGLSTAYLLEKSGHEVVLFEKQTSLGMDSHSLSIENDSGVVRADVPSRMFNALQWPRLVELYHELGVEFQPVRPTQSFGYLDGETYLKLDVANRPWLAAQSLVNPRIRKTVQESRRLQTQGEKDLAQKLTDKITFEQYLNQHEFDHRFIFEFLYPTLSSTVLTCSYEALDNYPAVLILRVLKNLADSPTLLRTRKGTIDVVNRMTNLIGEVRLDSMVTEVKTHTDFVNVTHAGHTERFDHLVFATQANHARQLLPNSEISETLSKFVYEEVEVVVHTDRKLMPANPDAWSTFNMILSKSDRSAMCSVWLNEFHDQWTHSEPIFQTINPICEPSANSVLSRVTLQRPIVNSSSFELWRQIMEYHEQPQRIWFAGSYAARGVPLLESGVCSSWNVVNKFAPSHHTSAVIETRVSRN